MNLRNRNIVFLLATVIFVSVATAQTIKTRLNKTKIRLGEQIKLELVVSGAKSNAAWFQFPDSINHIEVVSRSKIDTNISTGQIVYRQLLILTSFDSGRWQFPSLAIAGIQQVTAPFYIDVVPVDVSKLNDYNDIHQIIEADEADNWLLFALIAAAILIVVLIVLWLIKRRKKIPQTIAHSHLSPLDWAFAELNKLHPHSLQTPAEVKKFYSQLTAISRTFFNMQLQHQSFHKTTGEWMTALQPLEVNSEVKMAFFQVLRLADAVKFAKFLPSANEHVLSVEVAKTMFEKVATQHTRLHLKFPPGEINSKMSKIDIEHQMNTPAKTAAQNKAK